MEFYDGTKLLSMLDLDGNKPELYIVTTNRTGGKTTWFSRYCVKKFRETGSKFAIIYRFNYELDGVADKFFKDIGSLFFQGKGMKSKKMCNGLFHELFLYDTADEENTEVSCGYALTLNSADMVKKYSHFFSDVDRIMFDEFQSENNHYCSGEVKKFISIHTSIARGQGKQSRYVPVYMLGNSVSLINPYYTELGISSRLRDNTKFLKGHGFVLEQGYVDSANRAQKESAFNRAFANNSYVAYASEGLYLNDNMSFIDKPNGIGKYMGTIRYKGKNYGIRAYLNEGVVYCDDKADETYPTKISVTTDDFNINYVMLKANSEFVTRMRFYFEHGCFRFKDLGCKEALMCLVGYRLQD